MKIHVLFFGSLVDAAAGQDEIVLEEITTINALKEALLAQYPALANYTFRIALNQEITEYNHSLKSHDVVALLPPFAGG